jgi:hypothetical protein
MDPVLAKFQNKILLLPTPTDSFKHKSASTRLIMTRSYIPFLAFLILLLLTIPFSFDFATSVVPGWHTTIFPPYFTWGLIVMIVLLLVTIGYWLLSKRTDRINRILFAIHFALTIPIVIYLKSPSILLDIQLSNQQEMTKAIAFRMKLIPIAWILFIGGQILFLFYYTRTIRARHIAT